MKYILTKEELDALNKNKNEYRSFYEAVSKLVFEDMKTRCYTEKPCDYLPENTIVYIFDKKEYLMKELYYQVYLSTSGVNYGTQFKTSKKK